MCKGEVGGQSENLSAACTFYPCLGIFSSLTCYLNFFFKVLDQLHTEVAAANTLFFSQSKKVRAVYMLSGVHEYFLQDCVKIWRDFDLANTKRSSACLFICWAPCLKDKVTCRICTFVATVGKPANIYINLRNRQSVAIVLAGACQDTLYAACSELN